MENRGLRRGALELLNEYHSSQRAIAEAYLKGNISRHLESFVLDVICTDDIEEARNRLERNTWRLIERVAQLEKEVKLLQEAALLIGNTVFLSE